MRVDDALRDFGLAGHPGGVFRGSFAASTRDDRDAAAPLRLAEEDGAGGTRPTPKPRVRTASGGARIGPGPDAKAPVSVSLVSVSPASVSPASVAARARLD